MYVLLNALRSRGVTMTTLGVPGGTRSEDGNSLEQTKRKKSAPQTQIATSCSPFRRSSGDGRERRAYGGGFELLRGGRAKCIPSDCCTDQGSLEGRRPRTSGGRCSGGRSTFEVGA